MKKIIFGVLLSVLLGCESDNLSSSNRVIKQVKPTVALTHSEDLWIRRHYVDFEKFKQGRPCGKVRFNCLPESMDKSWQSIPTADGIEDFEFSAELKNKYRQLRIALYKAKNNKKNFSDQTSKKAIKSNREKYRIYEEKRKNYNEEVKNFYKYIKNKQKQRGGKMLITDLDKDFFKKIKKRRFLEEMEKRLEKEFPGFWREVPKKVRYRWIRRAMNKAKKFGYDPELNRPIVELCARIGLDFDLDPKWEYITKFIARKRIYIGMAVRYIDFTLFNKDKDYGGTRITDWSLQGALRYLPDPERPVPGLHDQ